jgi:hypothetical protein
MSFKWSKLFREAAARPGLGLAGFDDLLQTFENCRAGITDETLAAGRAAVERFFTEIYEKERPRFQQTIHLQDPSLPEADRELLFEKIDNLVRKVVIPAYSRLAGRFTARERNDFYLLPEPLHGLEIVLWAVGGMALGALVIWAPFIPIWSKESVLVFVIGGLVYPSLRRWLAVRRYQRELNELAARADDEAWRADLAFVTGAASSGPYAADRDSEHAEQEGARPRKQTIEQGGG